ncbi:MAG: flagellin [Phycisphaerales bacterium]
MTRINTNVPSMIARQRLNRSGADLQVRLERLSTGLRINRGKDDPAGLIISERISTELKGIEQAISNSERASSVIATTEGSLTEINDLLNSIKALTVEAANSGAISDEERDANQLQIDSAIQSITRIANTATFGGQKLLDGSLGYVTSGIAVSTITKASITAASFINASAINVSIDVIASAQKGSIYLSGDNSAVAGPPADGIIVSATTIQVRGPEGVRELEILSGTALSAVVANVNALTGLTGVTASLVSATDQSSGLVFQSSGYGSNNFVSVERLNRPSDATADNFRTFKLDGNADVPADVWADPALVTATRDQGRDIQALINGNVASGDGLTVSIGSPSLALKLDMGEMYAIDPTLAVTTFDITGGGSLYQLGPSVNALQQSNIGIQSIAAEALGGVLKGGSVNFLSSLQTGKSNSLATADANRDYSTLSDIVDEAIDEVSILRGRLGAFERNVLDANSRSLQGAFENLTASQSLIRDADFAAESSELTRAQILQSSGTTVLSLANQQSQQVLQLLG